MVREVEILQMRKLRNQGMTIADIARVTGYSEPTIRKYLKWPEGKPVRYKNRPKRPSKLDPYKPHLMQRMSDGVFNCVVLLTEIQALGYTGGYTLVKDFVAPHRRQFRVQAVRRFETDPGEQAQVDWGYLGTFELDNKQRKVWVLAMLLGYSRYLWAHCVTDMELSTLLWLHQKSFRALDGVPRTIVYDNMKTVTPGRDATGKPSFQPAFLRFALDYGFQPRLTAPYKPRSKGKVEAAIRYIKLNFAAGRVFTDLADLNGQLTGWLRDANQRIHATTRAVPEERLTGEALLPLPRIEPVIHRRQMRRVTTDHEISYLGTRYSVPWTYAGRDVAVEETTDGRLLIYWHDRLIAEHDLAPDGVHRIRLSKHEAGLFSAQRRGLATGLHQILADAPEVEQRPLSAYEEVAANA